MALEAMIAMINRQASARTGLQVTSTPRREVGVVRIGSRRVRKVVSQMVREYVGDRRENMPVTRKLLSVTFVGIGGCLTFEIFLRFVVSSYYDSGRVVNLS